MPIWEGVSRIVPCCRTRDTPERCRRIYPPLPPRHNRKPRPGPKDTRPPTRPRGQYNDAIGGVAIWWSENAHLIPLPGVKEFAMRSVVRTVGLLLGGLLVLMTTEAAGDENAKNGRIEYPQTRRGDVVDDYHGTKVPDPYRWLEDDVRKSKEVAEWVAAENRVTQTYLDAIPERDRIRKRLTELWNYARYSPPIKIAGRYYFFKNDGLQNQAVLYVVDKLDGKPKLVLDPNKWSKDGTVALSGMAFSEDGKYLAYGVAEAGSDWVSWKVLGLSDREPLKDEIKWSKFGNASWTHDGRGFFYSRFPEPRTAETFQSLNLNQKVYYHRLGTPQSDDVLVYQRAEQPKWTFTTAVTEDGRYLIVDIGDGTTSRKSRITYKDLHEPYGLPVELIDKFEAKFDFIDNDGPLFYFVTDLDAPRGRVVAIDIRKPERKAWQEIIPQADNTLETVNLVGNLLVANYLKDARTQVKMFKPDGTFVREVQFPGIGTASGFGGKRSDTET